MPLTLHGFHYSVYVRIVRLVMLEKGLSWTHVEVDPFGDLPASYLAMNPFGRVPTLVHDHFVLYETSAIIRYLDEVFAGMSLQPDDVRSRARMNQIIAIADSYAYWPLVRDLYAQRVFAPAVGEETNEEKVRAGLIASAPILLAIERLISGDEWLCGKEPTLADFHFGAMMACFTATPEGAEMVEAHPDMLRWWETLRRRPSMVASDPGLPSLN
jgi:glutathione S-transferase